MNFPVYLKNSLLKITESFLFKSDHFDKYNYLALGIVALIGHVFFHIIWKYILPLEFENIYLRIFGVFSCAILLTIPSWKQSFNWLVRPYWFFAIFYNLSFFFSLNLIMNRFVSEWFPAHVAMIFIVILFVPNLIVSLALILSGVFFAALCALFYDPSTLNNWSNIISHLPIYGLSFIAAYVFGYSSIKGRTISYRLIIEKERAITQLAKQNMEHLRSLAGSIAHEIRNPLGQIKYSLDTLAEDLAILDPNNVGKIEIENKSLDGLYSHIDRGQTSIKRGLQIISMILDEVKGKSIDSDQLLYLSAQKITQKAVNEYAFENVKEQSKIKTDLTQDFIFKIDETLYIFILFNLIKNALFYVKTHEYSEIYIRTEKGKDQNYVFVKDTGPGISADNLKKLFDSFFTSGKKEGTGLGLSYCHRVMEVFGGSISCESIKGEFTEFRLSFPIPTESELKAHKNSIIESAKSIFFDRKVLLVDDELTNRMIVRQQLKPFAIHVDEAENGLEAVEKVKNNLYDFILMDINMPNMNGYEASKAIREFQSEQSKPLIPIFAYSSEPRQIAQLKASDSGMCTWIAKPCSQVELIRAIQPELEQQAKLLNAPKDFSDKVVLIADDNEINLQIVQAYLKKYKIKKILKATNGTAVLDILKTETCDLILMDIQMPGMDGLEATRQLRLQDNFQSVPIVAISGEDSDEYKAEASSSGINDYIVKPITPDALKKVLTQWL